MRRLLFILIPAALHLTACATIHGGGTYAVPVKGKVSPATFAADLKGSDKNTTDKGLLVSGSENTSLSSDYFTLIDLTFENKSSDWLRVTKVAIDFGSDKANSEIRFPVGQDLIDWAQSAQQIKAIHDYNMQMAMALGVAAGGVTLANGSKSTQNAGAAMVVGSGMVLAADSIGKDLDSLQRAKVIPEDHLLSGNFSVPPGLPKKKWITLYTNLPNDIPFVKKMALTLTYENGTTETVMLKLREPLQLRGSNWQKKNPEVIAARKEEQKRQL